MDTSSGTDTPFALTNRGRFTRVFVQTAAGEIEARLSEFGNWELRVRRDEDTSWRLACLGDLDCGAVTSEPVVIPSEERITRGPITVEPLARRATVDGSEVCLAKKEFALLLALISQPDRVFYKEELLETIWNHRSDTKSRTLDSHASRLRRKLRAAGADHLVINCWGLGYRLWDRADLKALPPRTPMGAVA